MTPNKATVDLVKHFEGCRLTSYKDPIGIWTVGYGLTTAAGVRPVGAGLTITQAEADDYLAQVLQDFGNQILPMFTKKPTPNEYGAMLSLSYNIGPGAFKKSTCLRRFNAGDTEGAAEALTWFNKAGGKVLNGLIRRRAAEHDLMLAQMKPGDVTPQPDPELGFLGLLINLLKGLFR